MCRWKPSSWTTTRPTVRPPRSLTNSPRRPFWPRPRTPPTCRHTMGHVAESDAPEMRAGTAACLMLRTSALDRVGFCDPRYSMFGEHLDLCYRLMLGGRQIFHVPSASATHRAQPTPPER